MISAALPDLDALDIEALKALVIAQRSELLEQRKELTSTAQEIEHLKLVIEKYRRMIFGRKSEKLTAQLEQLEFRLEELETAQAAEEARQAATEAAAPSSTQPAAKRRSRPSRKPLPEELPREVVTHLPPHSSCPDCGGALRQFGEDVSEQLERIPATFKVIRHVRPKFACAACEHVVEAPAPARPIERGLPGPALLAHVLVSKYADHQPLYRQSQIYAREGVDLERSTLAGWVGAASELLAPLVEEIRKHILAAAKIHADDTPVAVLAPGNGKTKTGRLWTYVRDDRPAGIKTAPAAWFAYSEDRKGEHPRAHLKDFKGALQAGVPSDRSSSLGWRPMPTRDFIISTATAISMKSRAGLIPGASSTTSTWPTHRQPRQKPLPASERCMESRTRFAASPPHCAARSARHGPSRCSTNCATGLTRRCVPSRPRARPQARSAMRCPTGVR
jgi:transposase